MTLTDQIGFALSLLIELGLVVGCCWVVRGGRK